VRLLDSDWLLQRAARVEQATSDDERRRLSLPYRQALEQEDPDAFLSTDLLRTLPRGFDGALPVCAVSHAWLSPEHPDELGHQLLSLAGLILRAQRGELPSQQTFTRPEELEGGDAAESGKVIQGYQKLPKRFGIFYDWTSLFQKNSATGTRTEAEGAAFKAALQSMQLWYAHTRIFVIMLTELPEYAAAQGVTPYLERGWPTCERAWAMLAKPHLRRCWPMLLDAGSPTGEPVRLPPMSPARLEELLSSKRFTSRKADLPLVLDLYRQTAIECLGGMNRVRYANHQWSGADFECVVSVLPLLERCKFLGLSGNQASDVGAAALANALRVEGTLPKVETIVVMRNGIGDTGMAAIADAVRSGCCPLLSAINLAGNNASAEGRRLVEKACAERKPPVQADFDFAAATQSERKAQVITSPRVGAADRDGRRWGGGGQRGPTPGAKANKATAARGSASAGGGSDSQISDEGSPGGGGRTERDELVPDISDAQHWPSL
jgi:hypothetical protein